MAVVESNIYSSTIWGTSTFYISVLVLLLKCNIWGLLPSLSDGSFTHHVGHQQGLSVTAQTELDACWTSTVEQFFFPEWSTVKQWFGKSADPWVSSLWQQCPGARHPLCSDLNKELGWRLELEHAKKQCTSPALTDLSTPPPPPSFLFPKCPSCLVFFSPVPWLLRQHECGSLFPLEMLIMNLLKHPVMSLLSH